MGGPHNPEEHFPRMFTILCISVKNYVLRLSLPMSDTELVRVLQEEFSVSAEELVLARRHARRLQEP